jgi:hypothetical protein
MGKVWSHERQQGKDEWLTPPNIIEVLGPFDLDPCAPINRPWEMAKYHYTVLDNGLTKKWNGRVWCNPPYGTETPKWLEKLSNHGNGIALIYARTETKMFFDYIWDKADGIMFLRRRLTFYHVDGTLGKNAAGAPSCLVAYGEYNAERLKDCSLDGKYVSLK